MDSDSQQHGTARDTRKIAILVSGSGSNLQAFIDAWPNPCTHAKLALVISNRPNVQALSRASRANIPHCVIDHTDFAKREDFDEAMHRMLKMHNIDMVVLAGFMRILGTAFLTHWSGRIINIHPSLLPAYRGLGTHKRALADGADRHGCSVHFVVPELDAGPVISQAYLPIEAGDTPETLQKRIQSLEHKLYPLTLAWLLRERELPSSTAVDNCESLLGCLSAKALAELWQQWQDTGEPFATQQYQEGH